jgi:hypothetical protein
MTILKDATPSAAPTPVAREPAVAAAAQGVAAQQQAAARAAAREALAEATAVAAVAVQARVDAVVAALPVAAAVERAAGPVDYQFAAPGSGVRAAREPPPAVEAAAAVHPVVVAAVVPAAVPVAAAAPPRTLTLVLKDDDRMSYNNKKYEIHRPAGAKIDTLEGRTSATGRLSHAIPADVAAAELWVWFGLDDAPHTVFDLDFGAVGADDTGLKALLARLGLRPGTIDNNPSAEYTAAIRVFQESHAIAGGVDGQPSAAVRAKAVELLTP